MDKRRIATFVFVAAATVMNAATRVTYVDFPGGEVEMLPGSSEQFTNALTAFAGASTVSLLQPIAPYSVIVKNRSPSALTVIMVRLDLKDTAGGGVRHVAGLQSKILPQEMALITPIGGLNIPMRPSLLAPPPIPDHAGLTVEMAKTSQLYRMQTEVVVSLDSVVFDDGSVIGPDTIHNLERMNLWRDADRSVVTELLKRAPAERFAYLQGILDTPEKPAMNLEDIDQFDQRRRSSAELMGMFMKTFPNEDDLRLRLTEFLAQTPQLHRRGK